jgi:hypothetical protein
MFGSIFYNCWAALFSFAVYFIWAIQDPYAYPLPTIGASFVVAVIGFIAMFIIRYFIGYVFYTPKGVVFSDMVDEQGDGVTVNGNQNQFVPQNERTTVEIEENNTEEIAKVVRTMLHKQDEAISR